ncbi:MAG: heme lyase CcmF/NrfE family subunit [Phycisphaerae bacterium]|nr:heme lyase CcmF/NrfE family subunit [Gemmatimonadaceae bacterium]
MILLGELSLWVALLMAAWGTTVSFAGGMQGRSDLVLSGRRALYATFVFTVVASAGILTAIFTHDFSIKFVASYTSSNLPKVYLFTAFWAGQAGSLLFWALVLSAYSTIAVATSWRANKQLMPWVTGTLSAIALFFLMALCLGANPYERLDWIPVDGRGMNPQLQNPAMAIHPPLLYLGLIATSVPFAFAIAALIKRKLDTEWLAAVRRWALVSWFFLTLGIVLGMWWAYVELGWGGYWAWDPVENSSFLPWLTGTAFLHSIMIQEKRGMLRKWNIVLVMATFLLTILGTFITRSGVIESVHAFAQSPVGDWFAGFLILATGISAYLVATRLRDLQAKVELESMVSREAAFLYNNLALVAICFATLWGTLYPILSEWALDAKQNVGQPFFNTVNGPLGLLLLLLTGVGPLIAWRRASTANLKRQFTFPLSAGAVTFVVLFALGMRDPYALMTYLLSGFVLGTISQEFVKGIAARRRMYEEKLHTASFRLVARNRRRYGGYIVHFGVVVMFCAFAGLMFRSDFEVDLKTGETFSATDAYGHEWKFTSRGVSRYEALNRNVDAATFAVTKDGKDMGLMVSEKRQHVDSRGLPTFEASTEVAILESLKQDVYLVFAGMPDAETSAIHIFFNPLVIWVWIGGIVMAVGGLIVMWPQATSRTRQGGYVAELPAATPEVLVGAGA